MHELIMNEEHESAAGKETNRRKADQRSQLPAHIPGRSSIHHKENQKERADGGEEIGTQMIKGRILHAVRRMGEQY